MKLKRVSGMVGALSMLCIGAVAAGLVAHSAAANAETTLQRIQRTGEVRIGYANESPFAYTTPDGTVTGESPEIAKKVFAKLGVNKVDAVLTEWGSLIPGLRAGRFDVIAAGMYVTPERCKQVAFANPQYQIKDTLLTLNGNPKNLRSYADVAKNPDTKLAVMAGSVELGYARDSGVKDGQLLQVPDTTAQLQAVRASRADAAAGTALTMKGLAAKAGPTVEAIPKFTDDPKHTGYGALAFRPDDTDLRDAVNQQLKAWLGTPDHLKTVAPFGFDKSNLTDKTTAQLCGG
ncbi:ectoine/hydroxyectoine ABC transporter substrate-binding protein EhuB [Caballeronia sordidicola]|jgi:polar amino acid transport system substrate-binding protein|nr:ectoine/hydroxyectoine ABC transporter substrate-binding protein EhuB [Caballeronia sordidicola]